MNLSYLMGYVPAFPYIYMARSMHREMNMVFPLLRK